MPPDFGGLLPRPSGQGRFYFCHASLPFGSPSHRQPLNSAMHRRLVLLTALTVAIATPVCSQELAREFPRTALRGKVDFTGPPAVVLNGAPSRLAPGARLHGTDNLLVLPTTLTGSSHTVHYTIEDTTGMIKELWILREAERKNKPWPKTIEERQAWNFNPATQTWTKP